MAPRTAHPHVRPSGALVGAVVGALLAGGVLAGCGGDDRSSADSGRATAEPVADDVQDCRETWQDLAREVDEALAPDGAGEGDTGPTPSDLRPRWTTVTAQVGYYATSGRAGDCEATLEQEEATIDALQDFSEQLAPLDVEKLVADYARDDLASYARPTGRAGRRAPTERAVARALADLERLAPQVTAQQAAGWQQAAATDLTSEAARDKAVADLEVLSGESQAYREVRRLQRLLDRAAAAVSDQQPSASPSASPSGSPSATPND